MKKNIIYSFLIAIVSFAFMACSSDDNEQQYIVVPENAKPSSKFTLGNFDDEKYANDAVKMDVKTWGNGNVAPEFKSIELFADGHFLITTPKAKNSSKRARLNSRATDFEGTFDIDNGAYIYGTFTCVKKGVYILSNKTKIEITDNVVTGYTKVTYTNSKGVNITIVVNINFNYKPEPVIRQICRSWRMDSQEVWLYTDKAYIGYGKQWMENFFKVNQEITVTPEGRQWGFDEDDILDDKGDYCRRVIFSPCGTFICFYQDGEVEVGRWEWKDKQNGILRCWEPFDLDDDDDDDDDYMDVTVRFDGKQMRMYCDYMDEENDIKFRAYSVSTFSARY